MRTAIALAVLLCLTTAATAGSTYRWVDKEGNVHYGDQVPMGMQGTLVKPEVGPASSGPTDAELAAAKARADKCKQLQDQLALYTKSGKITSSDALGNIHELSDDDKKKLIEQTQAKVDEACSGVDTAATP